MAWLDRMCDMDAVVYHLDGHEMHSNAHLVGSADEGTSLIHA